MATRSLAPGPRPASSRPQSAPPPGGSSAARHVPSLDFSRAQQDVGAAQYGSSSRSSSRSSAVVHPALLAPGTPGGASRDSRGGSSSASPLYETLKGLWLHEHTRRKELRAKTAELQLEVRSLRAQLSAMLPSGVRAATLASRVMPV